ncbi:MAG: hypothetical protein KDK62_07515 [Chlamydiia bacterium]|nr:hypothetical protein [Chlamydiia bacterium]
MHSPNLRRWLTPDPLDFDDGYNLYAYNKNNPLRYRDPDGRFAVAIPFAITIVEIALTALAVTVYCGAKALTENYDQHYGTSHSRSFDKFTNNLVFGRPQYLTSIPTFRCENKSMFSVEAESSEEEIISSNEADDKIEKDKFGNEISRDPKSIQDRLTLEAAQNGAKDVDVIIEELSDPRFRGMEKVKYETISECGAKSKVHFVRDPKTGERFDFKFKRHSGTK